MYVDPKFCLNHVHFNFGLPLVTPNRSSDSSIFILLHSIIDNLGSKHDIYKGNMFCSVVEWPRVLSFPFMSVIITFSHINPLKTLDRIVLSPPVPSMLCSSAIGFLLQFQNEIDHRAKVKKIAYAPYPIVAEEFGLQAPRFFITMINHYLVIKQFKVSNCCESAEI